MEVTYKNQEVERIACGSLTVQRIMEQVNARTAEMETAASLKAAGFADIKLHTTFGGSGAQDLEVGGHRKVVPR